MRDVPPRSDSANLDLLRAVAVSTVFFAHLAMTLAGGPAELFAVGTWELGRLGVLLFFVHTSLVLLRSLDRAPPTSLSGAAGFWLRRLFRIYPLAILTVVVVIASGMPPGPWLARSPSFTALDYASNLLLTQNLTGSPRVLSALWTLPLELQLYAFLPVLWLALRVPRARWAPLALWTLTAFVALVQARFELLLGRLQLLQFAPCFLAGLIAWRREEHVVPRLPGWSWPLALFALSALFLATGDDASRDASRGFPLCLLLGLLLPHFRELTFAPLTRVAALVARYSYGLYLAHVPILWLAFEVLRDESAAVQWCVLLAGSVVVPIAAYHAIEAPLIGLGKKLAARRTLSDEAG